MNRLILLFFPVWAIASMSLNAPSNTHQQISEANVAPKTWSVYATLDGFYWKSSEEGLPYAIKANGIALIGTNDPFLGYKNRSNNPKFEWDPGFRIGLGCQLPFDDWNFFSKYTRFTNQAKGKVQSDFPSLDIGILPLIGNWPANDDFPIFVQFASAHLNLDLNQIDFEMLRPCQFSRTFFLTPHMGLRWAQIFQHLRVGYQNFYNLSKTQIVNSLDQKYTNNFTGFGLLGGFDVEWSLFKCLSLVGQLSGSLLYGSFHCTQSSIYSPDIAKLLLCVPNGNYLSKFEQTQGILDLQLGAAFFIPYRKHRKFLSLRIGYEEHLYFGQNNFLFTSSNFSYGLFNQNSGDLSFSGWTASAKIEW